MKSLLLSIIVLGLSISPVWSEVVSGVFKTNPSEETGGYLHIEFGPCKLGKLKEGHWRFLQKDEILELNNL